MKRARTPRVLVLLVALAACRERVPEPTARPEPATPAAPAPARAPELTWNDPPTWQRSVPRSPMRRAQYLVPGPGGDGEMSVFYFGQGQGGSVEDNLERWYGQIEQPDGRATREVATRETVTVRGLRVTVTRAEGRFTGSAMPGGPPQTPREGWALLGAIAETPSGAWFFKLTGPRATVNAARPAFDDLVRSLAMR